MNKASFRRHLHTPGTLTRARFSYRISAPVVVLSFSLLLAVTIGHAADRGIARLRILVPTSTAALPFLLMANEQALPGTGLKVDLFAQHAQALAQLMRGDVDLLYSGTSQGWENRLDGSPLVMIDTGVWGISSLVGRDSSLKGFADLRGKRLALPFPGSPLDFQTRALLSRQSIDPDKDLTISYGPFAQSVQRLLTGRLDAAALPEPLATLVVKNNGLVRVAEYAQAWGAQSGGDPRSPQVSLFASAAFARDHGRLLVSLISAWQAATRKVAADPAAAARQFSELLGVEPAILEEATRHTLLAVPTAAENKTRVMAYYAAVSRYLPAGPRPLDERFFFLP